MGNFLFSLNTNYKLHCQMSRLIANPTPKQVITLLAQMISSLCYNNCILLSHVQPVALKKGLTIEEQNKHFRLADAIHLELLLLRIGIGSYKRIVNEIQQSGQNYTSFIKLCDKILVRCDVLMAGYIYLRFQTRVSPGSCLTLLLAVGDHLNYLLDAFKFDHLNRYHCLMFALCYFIMFRKAIYQINSISIRVSLSCQLK